MRSRVTTLSRRGVTDRAAFPLDDLHAQLYIRELLREKRREYRERERGRASDFDRRGATPRRPRRTRGKNRRIRTKIFGRILVRVYRFGCYWLREISPRCAYRGEANFVFARCAFKRPILPSLLPSLRALSIFDPPKRSQAAIEETGTSWLKDQISWLIDNFRCFLTDYRDRMSRDFETILDVLENRALLDSVTCWKVAESVRQLLPL